MTTSHEAYNASAANRMIGVSPPSEAETARMAELGVRFDGRRYRYRSYHYDQLADALNYAKLDRDSPGYQAVADHAPIWTDPEQPTEEQQHLMQEFGVTFDGRHCRYGSYRYDHLSDAVNYARLKR